MTPLFVEAMQKANTILLNNPDVIALDHNVETFFWLFNSTAVKKARKELRDILQEMWQSGAFNFEQVARGLRVDTQVVQALMDEEFITKYGL